MFLDGRERFPNIRIRERSVYLGRRYFAVFSKANDDFRPVFAEHRVNVARVVIAGDDNQAPRALTYGRHVITIPNTLGFFK